MSTLTLRATKGSPLTNTEVDTNFSNLNTDKLEATYAGAMNSLTGGSSIVTLGTVTTGTWSATAIGATKGGTGLTTYATGDILYASAANTLSKLTKPATASYLKMASDGTPSWDTLGLDDITATGTITTGTWNADVIVGQYGGTGVANTGKTITLGGNLTTSGAYATTLTVTALTNVTLPTTGTLATLAGAESLTNKKLGSLTSNGLVTTSGGDGTLSVTTTLGVGTGGTGTTTAFTAGSVVFAGASGVYSQDNANLFWDDTNNRLGIGTATPSYVLDVVTATADVRFTSSTGTNLARLNISNTGGSFQLGIDNSTGANFGFGAYSRVLWNDGAYPLVLTTNSTQRMAITSAGGVAFGTSASAYGTSGQLLQSNGNAAPTWVTPSYATTGKAIAMAMVFGG